MSYKRTTSVKLRGRDGVERQSSILGHPAQKIESLKVSIDYDSHLEQASVLGLSGTYLIIGEDFLLVPG